MVSEISEGRWLAIVRNVPNQRPSLSISSKLSNIQSFHSLFSIVDICDKILCASSILKCGEDSTAVIPLIAS